MKLHLNANQSQNCPRADHILLPGHYKTIHYLLWGGSDSLQGISPLQPLSPGQSNKSYSFLLHPSPDSAFPFATSEQKPSFGNNKVLSGQEGSLHFVDSDIQVSFITTLVFIAEKAMAPHTSALPWKIPWTEEPGRLQSMGSLESDTTERLHFHFSLSRIGEGNGNPLQCSCLENPRDGGAWWAAVYGVAQSRTQLK